VAQPPPLLKSNADVSSHTSPANAFTDVSWARLAWVLILGMASTQLLGALVPSPRSAGYVSLPLLGLTAASGIFYPITAMPGWLQRSQTGHASYSNSL
jgi:hypothetical protein